MSETQDEIPPPPPPATQQQTPPTHQTPHTVSTIKLPILKKGEYDIWAMKMEHYLAHTDYLIWEVIQNGNACRAQRSLPYKASHFEEIPSVTTLLCQLGPSWCQERCGTHRYLLRCMQIRNILPYRSLPSAWLLYCIIFNLQNIAFVSENTSSTNEVSTAHTSSHYSKHEQTTSSYSLLASQSSCPQLDHEDLYQVDEYVLEEIDLKWQVVMISMRIKKFYKKNGRKLQFNVKEPVGFDKTKVECYNCHKTGHFARECRTKEDNRRRDGWNPGNKDGKRSEKKEESRALVTVDGEWVDWTAHSEDDENFAFMASNSSGSNTQVCSNECKESYANLKILYDAQREQLSDASVEIKAYTQGLKKVEAQLVAHQQGQLWYEQKIKFMNIDLDDKTDVLTYHKTLLAKAQKEKDDLQVIVDKWNHSSKNLGKIINDHMTASDMFGLGYGDYRYSGNLSYENEISQSVFVCNKSDSKNRPLHTRLVKPSEMQAVPPPMTGNYFPSGPDIEIDDSQYTYGPQKTQPSETDSQTIELNTWKLLVQSSHSQKPKVNNKELGQRQHDREQAYLMTSDFNGGHVAFGWGSKGFITDQRIKLTFMQKTTKAKKEANEEGLSYQKRIFEQETGELVTLQELLRSSSTNIFSTLATQLMRAKDDSELPPIEDFHWKMKDTTDVYQMDVKSAFSMARLMKRFQVTPKTSHLSDCQKNFKENPPQEEVVNSWQRLITWQCKKQTIVATSTIEAEYVAAAKFHFIRDVMEELIQVLKIHTDDNVADLLTKAFDVSQIQFLVVSIGMINP
ncbi:ribonuclease H-like domain-containing protein [Tanacetum coccineum]